MNIYLVRHGETCANSEKRYLGSSDSPFTKHGIAQNKKVLSQLANLRLDIIYSSPSERCMALAHSIAIKKNMTVLPDERLAEIDFGSFESLTWQEACKLYPEDWENLCKDPATFRYPCGESQSELDKRIASFLSELMHAKYHDIAIISHGGAIMSAITSLLELDSNQKWRFKITHGSIATMEIRDGYAYIIL